MNKNKFKFLIIGCIGILVAGIFSLGVANASNSLIFVSPNSLNKNVGDNLVLTVKVDTAGSKVCGVEGKLQLDDKLSCQNIVLGEGLMSQKAPSCTDLSFLVGIPNCTTVNKTLFTVAVKAEKKGTAVVSFADVDVIGEGFSLSNTSVSGNYNLTAVPEIPVPVPQAVKPAPVVPVVVPTDNCVCEDWSGWQRVDCGAGDCATTQLSQSRSRSCNPLNCETTVENRCVADSYCATMIPVESSSQTASAIGAIGSMGILGWVILGIVLLLLIFFVYFYSGKKRR